jgi:dolichol-phosphate mannosyltransferase
MLIMGLINSAAKGLELINFQFLISVDLIMFGIVLFCIGIIGQYIGRIFDECRGRPNYIIENIVNKRGE